MTLANQLKKAMDDEVDLVMNEMNEFENNNEI